MKDIFAGNQVIHKMSDRYGWKEGSAEKTVLHGALGALTGTMSGGNALPVRQDLYQHIPDIYIYGTDTLLHDELTITARMPDRAFSSQSFVLTAKGNVIKEYYTEQLLQRGWIKGKNAKGEDFHIRTERRDKFCFYKDGYRLNLSFSIPLDQDPDKISWGTKEGRRYLITMAKTEFY